jgi:DMSO/TMAO reductase YedYZ molybdopterin-dependent catalytic subunit
MAKALEKESLIAWSMNGEPLPLLHGYPLRMVCSGWPASVCGKWINKVLIRDRVHDGPKMKGQSYRVPCKPVAPGTAVSDEDMCIIESMPVKSLITYPKSGVSHVMGETLALRGHAWAGDLRVGRMFVSTDFGTSWQRASLEGPVNRLAWQRWSAVIDFPAPGYYEVLARAEDENQNSQPVVLPGWNPRGYLNNACHRIAVEVRA